MLERAMQRENFGCCSVTQSEFANLFLVYPDTVAVLRGLCYLKKPAVVVE